MDLPERRLGGTLKRNALPLRPRSTRQDCVMHQVLFSSEHVRHEAKTWRWLRAVEGLSSRVFAQT